MIKQIKSLLYFPLAYYFRLFAQIQLAIWKPTIIVVTGSSGKTTLLHLIESQIQDKARYSHLANSSYGIPFDILGLHRKDLTIGEWPYLFLAAPFKAFKKPYKEKLYVVEADCDRPYEGKFLAELLKPKVLLWTNVSRTHTMNFDKLANRHSEKPSPHPLSLRERARVRADLHFSSVESAIAHEFGYFLEETKDLAIVNGDSELIKEQIPRSKASIKTITQTPYSSSDQSVSRRTENRAHFAKGYEGQGSPQRNSSIALPKLYAKEGRQARTINPEVTSNYKIFKDHTEFNINRKDYSIKALLPKETSYSVAMVNILLDFLNEQLIAHRHSGERSESRISQSDGRFWTSQNDEESKTAQEIKLDPSFSKFKLPPGRASVFKGIKNTTIIDSSYNATPDGVKSILGMFDQYPSDKKWLVMGDMIELGNEEQEEHEKLADMISSMRLEKIILVGPRLLKYAYPKLESLPPHPNPLPRGEREWERAKIEKFTMPKEALDYLANNLKGGEVILFKGARFLEGIIEHLLLDKNDVKKLCRREKVWQERRKKWNL